MMRLFMKPWRRWRSAAVVAGAIVALVTVTTPASAANGWGPLVRNERWHCTEPEVRPDPNVWVLACVVFTTDRTRAQAWAVVGVNRPPEADFLYVDAASVNLHNEYTQQPISHSACGWDLIPVNSYKGCPNPTVPVVCDDDVWAKIAVWFDPLEPPLNLEWRASCR